MRGHVGPYDLADPLFLEEALDRATPCRWVGRQLERGQPPLPAVSAAPPAQLLRPALDHGSEGPPERRQRAGRGREQQPDLQLALADPRIAVR